MLTLEITGRCPQMCGHCYGAFGPNLSHCSWDVFKALDEAKDLGFSFVQFIGGEILTNQQLVDYVKHALNIGYSVELYSALMLPLTTGWRKALLELGVLHFDILV
jgi:MoaA/NifB/PqqE/SkfB family radical SAM enzyme